MTQPIRAARTSIAGPAGPLQALIESPRGSAAEDPVTVIAIVCHPHPLYGGTLENKVVWTLARSFADAGATAIRFNFRGVGTSAGAYDEGRGETDDALAVAAWARQQWPGAALWLAGFSFGGAVAARAAARAAADRVVLVAPAVGRIEIGTVTPVSPWLVVQGDADEVVPAADVTAWAAQLDPPPLVRVLPGAGHFFHGRLTELREAVLEFVQG